MANVLVLSAFDIAASVSCGRLGERQLIHKMKYLGNRQFQGLNLLQVFSDLKTFEVFIVRQIADSQIFIQIHLKQRSYRTSRPLESPLHPSWVVSKAHKDLRHHARLRRILRGRR
jgi:hypothetical protein